MALDKTSWPLADAHAWRLEDLLRQRRRSDNVQKIKWRRWSRCRLRAPSKIQKMENLKFLDPLMRISTFEGQVSLGTKTVIIQINTRPKSGNTMPVGMKVVVTAGTGSNLVLYSKSSKKQERSTQQDTTTAELRQMRSLSGCNYRPETVQPPRQAGLIERSTGSPRVNMFAYVACINLAVTGPSQSSSLRGVQQ